MNVLHKLNLFDIKLYEISLERRCHIIDNTKFNEKWKRHYNNEKKSNSILIFRIKRHNSYYSFLLYVFSFTIFLVIIFSER